MLKIKEINTFDQFLELQSNWNNVLERSSDNNPFLTWEYLSTYWKHFGKNKKLSILCFENGNKIIGIAPLKQSRYNFTHLFGYDVISPLGYRGGDYTGLILAEREHECLKLMLDYLVEHKDWDFIYLFDFPRTSMNLELFRKIPNVIPKFELIEGTICPYISLPNSMDVFMQGLKHRMLKHVRRHIKKLEKHYKHVELKKYDEFGSVEESMEIFFELHQKRWTLRGMPGVFKTQKNRNFWLDVSKRFADKGWLALHFLMIDDKPIAALHCYEYNQKMFAVLAGFDPDYSQYSVGTILHAKIIEKCIDKKMKELDFLKGDESYKFDWTKTYRRSLNLRIVSKKFSSNLIDFTIRMAKKTKADEILGKSLNF